MKLENISSRLYCCKLFICLLIFIEFGSLSSYEKDCYKFSYVTDFISKECTDYRKHVLNDTAFNRNRKWDFNRYINLLFLINEKFNVKIPILF